MCHPLHYSDPHLHLLVTRTHADLCLEQQSWVVALVQDSLQTNSFTNVVKVKVKVKCIYMGTYQLFPAPVLTKSIRSVLFETFSTPLSTPVYSYLSTCLPLLPEICHYVVNVCLILGPSILCPRCSVIRCVVAVYQTQGPQSD